MNAHARANAVVRYRRALLDVWGTADDYARAYGAEWYGAANREARSLGDRYGFTTAQAAGVIAALSPRVRWHENLADAGVVLSWCEDARGGFTDGEIPAESLRGDCSAFTANILTATACAYADDPLTVLNGPKQRAFYRNIIGDAECVTVDVWATRAATRGKLDAPRGLGEYRVIERAYQNAARYVGVAPRDFQAAVWIAVRGSAA
jgi:hypothetical protein